MKKIFIILFVLFGAITGARAQPISEIGQSFRQILITEDTTTGDWQETDFAHVRLLSCQSGFQDTHTVLAGLEIDFHDGWTGGPLNIKSTTDSDSVESVVLIPLRTPASKEESWSSGYTGGTLVPILLRGNPEKDVTLTVSADLSACKNDICQNKIIQTQLNLTANTSQPSGWCGALYYNLQKSALPAKAQGIEGMGRINNNGDLQIRITFPKNVSLAEIQPVEFGTFTWITAQLQNNVFDVTLQPQSGTTLKQGMTIPFYLQTSRSFYVIDIPVRDDTFAPTPQPVSIWFIIGTGILIFLLSPMWSMWLTPYRKNKSEFKSKIRTFQLAATLGCTAFGILWIFNKPPVFWVDSYLIAGVYLITLLYFIIKPIPKYIWMLIPIICLMPKPFWWDLENISATAKAGTIFCWIICMTLPFNLWLLASDKVTHFFAEIQKEKPISYLITIRLPYIISALWIGLALLLAVTNPTPEFSKETASYPALVRISPVISLHCEKDRILLFNNTVVRNELLSKQITMYQLTPDSADAMDLIKTYGIQKIPVYILITKAGRIITIPADLTTLKLVSILNLK